MDESSNWMRLGCIMGNCCEIPGDCPDCPEGYRQTLEPLENELYRAERWRVARASLDAANAAVVAAELEWRRGTASHERVLAAWDAYSDALMEEQKARNAVHSVAISLLRQEERRARYG